MVSAGWRRLLVMPLHARQWDGLGHVLTTASGWNNRVAARHGDQRGRPRGGIEHMAEPMISHGMLLNMQSPRPRSCGRLRDHSPMIWMRRSGPGSTSSVGRGDILLVRTGQLARATAQPWGDTPGGPAPRLSFITAEWLHAREVAAVATDTWGGKFARTSSTNCWSRCPSCSCRASDCCSARSGTSTSSPPTAPRTHVRVPVAPARSFSGAVGSPVNPIAVKLSRCPRSACSRRPARRLRRWSLPRPEPLVDRFAMPRIAKVGGPDVELLGLAIVHAALGLLAQNIAPGETTRAP